MTGRTSLSSKSPTPGQQLPRRLVWPSFLVLPLIISLGCLGFEQSSTVDPASSGGAPSPAPLGFDETDCTVPGLTFPSISIGYQVDKIFDGPSLICDMSISSETKPLISAHIGITAYRPDRLDGFYQQGIESIRGYVDQANERNAIPDIPDDARDLITFIHDDENRYVFMITSQANVYDCLLGSGYGEEKIEGKYLVTLSYQSCELGDASAYVGAMQALEQAALLAIAQVSP